LPSSEELAREFEDSEEEYVEAGTEQAVDDDGEVELVDEAYVEDAVDDDGEVEVTDEEVAVAAPEEAFADVADAEVAAADDDEMVVEDAGTVVEDAVVEADASEALAMGAGYGDEVTEEDVAVAEVQNVDDSVVAEPTSEDTWTEPEEEAIAEPVADAEFADAPESTVGDAGLNAGWAAESAAGAAAVAATISHDRAVESVEPVETDDWQHDEAMFGEEAADDLVDAGADQAVSEVMPSDAPETAAWGRRISDLEEVSDGGFGMGSAAPIADGAQPLGHAVQAYRDTMTFRVPEAPGYDSREPDVWFFDEDSARRAGFTPSQTS